MMITAELQTMLAMLEYSPKWIAYGFLNEARLCLQARTFQTSDDHNTEHYRYSTFREILRPRDHLNETEIERYIELAQIDGDGNMAISALCDLLLWDNLTPAQFDRLCLHPAFADARPQKLIAHRRLYTALEARNLTQAVFEQCLAARNDTIQRCLLVHPDLSDVQLEVLTLQGTNKAIRNIAAVTLRARNRRENKH